MTRRLVSALLSGDPDNPESSLRRFARSLFSGVLIATIVIAAIGVYGLLAPARPGAADGDLIIMKETGAGFVLVDGTLHPVLNWTSALLFVGSATPTVRHLSRASLTAYPMGAPVGIPNAPDPPPAPDALLGPPWAACSVPGTAGSDVPTAQVLVGQEPTGSPTPADPTLLVYTAAEPDRGGDRYLLWQGRRYRIPDTSTLTALQLGATSGIRIAPQVIETITAGPDLVAPTIAGTGSPSPLRIGGVAGVIGRVYRSGPSYFVLTATGLAPVSELAARLLMIKSPAPVEIRADEAAPHVTDPVRQPNLPTAVPQLTADADDVAMVCARHRGDESGGRTTTVLGFRAADAQRLAIAANASTSQVDGDGSRTADRILVRSGHGALVRAVTVAAGAAGGDFFLVTDQGVRYPIRNSAFVDAVRALGYDEADAVPITATMLSLVPTGPTLDPAAARVLQSPGGRTSPSTATPSPSPTSR